MQPSSAYTLTLGYDPAQVGSTEPTMRLFWWDGRRWLEQPAALDLASHTLTAVPDHTSLWALMVEDQRTYLPQVLVGQ